MDADWVRDLAGSFRMNRDGSRILFWKKGWSDNQESSPARVLMAMDEGARTARHICDVDTLGSVTIAWNSIKGWIYFNCTLNEAIGGHSAICHVRFDAAGEAFKNLPVVLNRSGNHFIIGDLSPDGKLLCFIHQPGLSMIFDNEVWIADLSDGGTTVRNPRRLTWDSLADRFCRFLPDGRSIYWSSHRRDGHYYIFRMNIDGSHKTKVVEQESAVGTLAISNTGLIAYESAREGNPQLIEVVDPVGNRVITFAGECGSVRTPVFVDG